MAFNLQDPETVLEAVAASLSPERFATYLAAGGGDRAEALRLYTWNTALSAAFYGPLQGLEVAVRNAMHCELSARYGAAWLTTPAQASTPASPSACAAPRRSCAADPPHIVAALPFGFWVSLLGRGGLGHGGGRRTTT